MCLTREDGWGHWYRLFHKKTGRVSEDQYYWMQGPSIINLHKKEAYLKPDYWMRVREAYLKKKNMYLCMQDNDNHPSYNCYIEAVNEVYTQVRRKWIFGTEFIEKKGYQNYDKNTFHLPRQVSCMTTQPFTNLGNTGHNKVDELNDTTDLATKGARLDALSK